MINVMLADDHDMIRYGLKRMLDDVQGINVIAEVKTGEQAIKQARRMKPDIILMDICMPGMGGLEATRRITQSSLETRVIAFTVYEDNPFPSCIIDAGASGYLTKGSGVGEVIDAITTVHTGKNYYTKDIADKLVALFIKFRDKTPLDTITVREMVVLLLVAQGVNNRDISELLCISPKTTSTHRYRLFEKLGVGNDVELTRWAIRHGIVHETTVH